MKAPHFIWLLSGILLVSVLETRAIAGPFEWPGASGGNGHFYDKIGGDWTWPTANTAAQTLSFNGLNGHLATINSAAEQDFIKNTVGGGSGFLGGFQDTNAPDYSEP